jgi:hypothetical protein
MHPLPPEVALRNCVLKNLSGNATKLSGLSRGAFHCTRPLRCCINDVTVWPVQLHPLSHMLQSQERLGSQRLAWS